MMEKDRNDKNIGKKLDGRYEITERIGEGGMADVYRANDVVDQKTVAVKILKKEYAEKEEFIDRFRNESKAIAALDHPNIVKVYDVGFSNRIQFIVMEYIDGITLNEYMEQSKPLGWKDAVHFATQILRALQHAHSKGIVHRDIKPQNIMMLRDGTIKVMDFGIAKFARETGKTCTDKAIGTVHYISPEQARGAETSAKSDLYSVGVLLFEMLTGKKPFDTETNDPVSIAVMHMQAEVPRPSSIEPNLATGLEEIILKAMQKDPAKRYQSANEMIEDIENFKENPDIVFGYFPEITGSASDEGKTRFFKTVTNEIPSQFGGNVNDDEDEEEYEDDEDEDDEDDDDEYEEEEGSSLFIPILTGVIIVVALVGVFFLSNFIINFIKTGMGKNTKNEWAMPELIGQDYAVAYDKWHDMLQFKIESREYNSEYESGKIFYQSVPHDNPVTKGQEILVKVSRGSEMKKLADYTGWDFQTARTQIAALGCVPEPQYIYDDEIAEGKIVSTDPAGPVDVAPGAVIKVVVSRGPNIQTIPTPTFIGQTYDEASKIAKIQELELVKIEVDSSEEKGKVLEQDPQPTESVIKGATIKLTVSNGIAPETTVKVAFAVPNNAHGNFHIKFLEGGSDKVTGPSFNAELSGGVTYVEVKGSGKMNLLALLYNESNGKYATLGTYEMDFETKTSKAAGQVDIMAAFEAVGGLGEINTTPPTTQPPVAPTTTPATQATATPTTTKAATKPAATQN